MNLFDNIILSKIHEAVSFPHLKDKKMSITDRKCFCFTMALSGEIVYMHNGVEIHSDCNHVLFIPSGATYNWICTQTGEFTVLNFSLTDMIPYNLIQSIPITSVSNILVDHRELEYLWANKPVNYEIRSKMIFYRMLLHISDAVPKNKYDPIIENAIKIMQKEHSDPLFTIKSLAERLKISEGYFRKMFKNNTGKSPIEYLMQIRINSSIQMLLQTNNTIAQISLACGYNNQYYYSNVFNKMMGVSPAAYRNQIG